jgi:hypothetical protein
MKNYLFQEADFYGASSLIFDEKKKPIVCKATWMHGLGPILRNRYLKNVIVHYNETHLPLHLVNNDKTVKELANQKIDAVAVGMPYIYTNTFFQQKRGNTKYKRIYFPPHSIGFTQKTRYKRWKNIIAKYNCDAISLTYIDYHHLKKYNYDLGNISIILGAKSDDKSSLERMALTFFSTKEIITDTRSSHLAYAAASGVKVRVISEVEEKQKPISRKKYIPKKYAKDFQYENNLEKPHEKITESVFMTGNDNEIREYSEYILGIDYRKSLDDMRSYLTPQNGIQVLKIASLLLVNKIMRKAGI